MKFKWKYVFYCPKPYPKIQRHSVKLADNNWHWSTDEYSNSFKKDYILFHFIVRLYDEYMVQIVIQTFRSSTRMLVSIFFGTYQFYKCLISFLIIRTIPLWAFPSTFTVCSLLCTVPSSFALHLLWLTDISTRSYTQRH